jgi:hypothetical protein
MDHDTIKVEVNYTPEDIQSFQKAHLYGRISRVRLVLISLLFIGCAVVLFLLEARDGEFPIVAFTLLMFPIIFLIVFPSAIKKNSKKMFETSKLIRNTQSFQIDQNAIKIFSPTTESNLTWDMLYKAVETKDSFLFYISNVQAHIIPKRYFNEEDDQVVLLRDYIKKAPIPKDDKKSIFSPKRLGIGCLIYVILFFVILLILLNYGG